MFTVLIAKPTEKKKIMSQDNNKDTRNRSEVFTFDCEQNSGNALIQIFAVFLHNKKIGSPIQSILSNIVSAVARRCSVKKMFLKISQNLQENTCVGVSFLIK